MNTTAFPLPQAVGLITARALCDVIGEARCNLSEEVRTQADLFQHLTRRLPELDGHIRREVRLSNAHRIDLMVERIGIEVKLKGRHRAFDIYRQIADYADHPDIDAIILASTVTMCLPDKIAGKPAFHVNLGRAWLI